jgi:hypothetical protein
MGYIYMGLNQVVSQLLHSKIFNEILILEYTNFFNSFFCFIPISWGDKPKMLGM